MTSAEIAKLRWRCRRGTRELDGLMLGWLEHYYPQASQQERAEFSALLDLQDPELMGLIIAPEHPHADGEIDSHNNSHTDSEADGDIDTESPDMKSQNTDPQGRENCDPQIQNAARNIILRQIRGGVKA